MPEYDFLTLSPPEFEDLTRDILQKNLNVKFESFTSGRDSGIDLRYSISKKASIIVQCKRYGDYSHLFKNLKLEVDKVKKLSPNRYIISTTVGLTPKQKEAIFELFTPYIKNYSDILGRNDLNNLLSKDIEIKHFKLWLSSTNILDRILHSKIYNQTSFEESAIKSTINVYVDNESYIKASKIIKERKYVIISGIPGIGKTTLARILVYHYLANGFEEFIFLSDSINDAYTFYKEGVKQVFLFDDFLGTNFLENKLKNNEEQRIIKFIQKIAKSEDKILILTTREYILAQAKQKYHVFDNEHVELSKCTIDLSTYTNLVKAKILYNHLFFSNIPELYINSILQNKNYLRIIHHPNYSPRVLEVIMQEDVWRNITPSNFAQKFIDFLKNPTSVWKHVYENQISKLSQCILANLMSLGTPVLLNQLSTVVQNFAETHSRKYGIAYSEIEFKKGIKELENTFIKTLKDKKDIIAVEYQNPSVQDFLVYYFTDYPDILKDIINSAIFFNQIFRVFSLKDFDSLKLNKISLPLKLRELSVKKLTAEIENFTISTLKGNGFNSWSHEYFSDYTKLNLILQEINLEDFPLLKNLVKKEFEKILNPSWLSDEDLPCYINLIIAFFDEYEISAKEIMALISENIRDLSEIMQFEKLYNLSPDDYERYTATDEFTQVIINILFDEAESANDDLENVLETLTSVADSFNVGRLEIREITNILETKIENERKDSYNREWDDDRSDYKSEVEENEVLKIRDMFDSLRSQNQ